MKYLILITSASAIAALDQATKLYIHTHFMVGESVTIIPNYFNFTYVRNAGGAFGLFNEANSVIRTILFILFPMIAFIIVLNILKKIEHKEKFPILALSFIVGGAIGNLIDRIHFNYVIDFLDFHLPNGWVWPTFNIADTAVVTGVLLISWIHYKNPEKIPM